MKTPVGLRPAAWEPRTRLIAAVVALVVVVAAVLWWVAGADGRRVDAACDLYDGQQGVLRGLLVDIDDAADASAAAGDTHLLPYFDNADSTLNSMRRWQATQPRVDAVLEAGDDAAARTFADLTDSVAQVQRLVEADVAADAVTFVPDVATRLDDADRLCS